MSHEEGRNFCCGAAATKIPPFPVMHLELAMKNIALIEGYDPPIRAIAELSLRITSSVA